MSQELLPGAAGHLGPRDADTLDLLELYLRRYDRPHTQRAYHRDIAQFFGTETVTKADAEPISFTDVNEHVERLEADGLKASTINRKLAALRGFFGWLVSLEVLVRNPADRNLTRRVRQSRQRHKHIVFLTKDEMRRLLTATDPEPDPRDAELAELQSIRDRALVTVLVYCVLRRSEAASMNAEHLRIIGGHHVLDLPRTKGGADEFVKVPPAVVQQIERVKEAFGFTTGPVWRSLSNNNLGGRLSAHSIYTIVKEAALKAGLDERVGAHTLRHTGCTLAIEAGASLQQVQAHARHKDVQTTMTYVHLRDRLRDSAADYIDLDADDK